MNKYNTIVIIGKAGSGKDTIAAQLCNYSDAYHKVVNFTTRPKRDNEIEGVDYHFVTFEDFNDMKTSNNELLEYTCFNGWYYGSSLKYFEQSKINVIVTDPIGARNLNSNIQLNCQLYYIIATDKTRLIRQLTREVDPDCIEIMRRFNTDNSDFSNEKINDLPYISIVNEVIGNKETCIQAIITGAKVFKK